MITNLITSSHLRLRQIWYNTTYGDINYDKSDQHLDKRKFQEIWRMVMMMLMMIIEMYIVHLREETIAGRSGQLQCCWPIKKKK